MKIISSFLVALLLLLVPSLGMAQEEPGTLARTFFVNVKPGMVIEFEKAYKGHVEWHRRNNDTWRWDAWEVVNGDNLGQYVVRSPGHHWSDFDGNPELRAADRDHYLTNVAEYVESNSSKIVQMLTELSRWPEGEEPPAYVTVIQFRVRYGSSEKFTYALEKVNKAIDKSNWPSRGHAWLEVVNGGEQPTYVLVLPRTSWADMKVPDKPLWAMIEEVYGRQGSENLQKVFRKLVVSETSSIARYRSDLTSLPSNR